MSDGDNATPGSPRPSEAGGDNQWLTRTPRRSRSAAPWERGASPEPSQEREESAEPTGNHTDGVTVADLIAKVTGTQPQGLAPAEEPKRPGFQLTLPPMTCPLAPTSGLEARTDGHSSAMASESSPVRDCARPSRAPLGPSRHDGNTTKTFEPRLRNSF